MKEKREEKEKERKERNEMMALLQKQVHMQIESQQQQQQDMIQQQLMTMMQQQQQQMQLMFGTRKLQSCIYHDETNGLLIVTAKCSLLATSVLDTLSF